MLTRFGSGAGCEICKPTADIPSTLQFHDLGGVSAPAPVPVGGDGLWRLFAHVLLGLDALKDRDSLRILDVTWRDRLMELVMSAMVRGRPGSLVESRIDRGPRPAQRLLLEVKRLHHHIQRDVVSAVTRFLRRAYPQRLNPVNQTAVTMMLFGMINWTFTWLRPGGAMSYAAFAEEVIGMLERGLAS